MKKYKNKCKHYNIRSWQLGSKYSVLTSTYTGLYCHFLNNRIAYKNIRYSSFSRTIIKAGEILMIVD